MRSWLFVPGDSEKKLAKALTAGADMLILDLEDSVALDRKPAARAIVAAFLAQHLHTKQRPRLFVRINPLTGPLWEDDLAAITAALPDGVVQPKPRSGEDVHRLSLALGHAESTGGGSAGRTAILAIITEVAVSILNMASYIGASSRLAAVTWGAEDLSAEIGASATRDAGGRITSPFALARDLTLFAAIAAEVAPIDTVFVDFRDRDGLARECAAAARDGFVGKMAIHPDQVAAINAAFTPSAAEIARAREIVRLFAENPGMGVVGVGGQMVDRPHLTKAERLLSRIATPGLG